MSPASAHQLVNDVIRALRDADIRFTGTPKLVRRPPSLGTFVTDNRRLFVKVTDKDPSVEWAGARQASAAGVATARPLHKPLRINDHHWVLPFKWIDDEGTAPTGVEVAAVMERIWAAPLPQNVRTMPWDAYELRARANIDATKVPAPVQTMLHRLIDESMVSVHARLSQMVTPPVASWTHGDLHGRNMVRASGRVHVIDWEHHGISLRENEASKYLQTALSEPVAGAVAVDDGAAFLDAVGSLGLDVELVWRLTGLRAVGAAGFLASQGGAHADWLTLCVDLCHRAKTASSKSLDSL